MNDKPELIPAMLVFAGPCVLSGKKPGELWLPEELAIAAKDADELVTMASAFDKSKKTYTIGAVYEAPARIEGGRIMTLNRDTTYRRMLDSDAISALALKQKGVEAKAAAERAEIKARKAGPCDDLLDQMAQIVAAAPFTDQNLVLSGLTREVHKRALAIWRKQR